jgi:patatin-related protein
VRELELRLALVCYGGASLAVYMNGISHEILKMVRASRAYQSAEGGRENFDQAAPRRPYSTDTEELYYELFQALGENIDLRVIVDVISGTSAGGINGIFLARAIAHDLDFDPLRNMWMNLGDVEELMEKGTLAERFSKFYLYPFIWMFGRRVFGDETPDAESKRKLSRFLRSRWFKPPFSGERMLSWMINACAGMGKAEDGPTLMPPGHKLDLFVSLTNFFGQTRHLKLHDPAEIAERQHKVTLNFTYQEAEGQETISDFTDDNTAGLGFAARATSSFPGAFPPIRFMDLDMYLAKVRRAWPARKAFMAKNFPKQIADPNKLEAMSFIDGGVTNNKPFGEAVEAIYRRPAHREVDRRIIYVDPSPDAPSDVTREIPKAIPGFFRTILSSLAEIPRNEPIFGDLRAIAETNKETRRLENVFNAIEGDVRLMVDNMLDLEGTEDRRIETAMLASWRERAHRLAQEKAGFGYGTYMQSKVQLLLEKLADLIVNIARGEDHELDQHSVRELVRGWAERNHILSRISEPNYSDLQAHIRFLRTFDVDYRVRRMRFTVKRLNQYLQSHDDGAPAAFYKLTKKQIYKSLEEYRARWKAETFTEGLTDIWRNKSKLSEENIDAVLDKIGDEMMLEDIDYISDQFMAMTLSGVTDSELQLTLFRAYVGYAFYDILTQPMTAHSDLLEVDEIRVDRISPIDCGHLHGENIPLKGTELFNFGAFFSRTARENDYLWGRIHASNRLTDFLLDAAGKGNLPGDFDADAFKKKLINKILDSEEKHMKRSGDLIKELREKFV